LPNGSLRSLEQSTSNQRGENTWRHAGNKGTKNIIIRTYSIRRSLPKHDEKGNTAATNHGNVGICQFLPFQLLQYQRSDKKTTQTLRFSTFPANFPSIGLRENLQESPIFNGKIYGFRLRFSLKPIQ
jgi:hypothetical protein